MNRSYIGISSRCGLVALWPENDAAYLHAQKAYRQRPNQAVSWWASFSDATAAEVLTHVAQGDRWSALLTIDRGAVHLGPILPGRSPHAFGE